MQSTEEKSWFVPLIIFVVLAAMVFGVLYYIFTDFHGKHYPLGRKEFDYGGRPVQSTATADQVLLTKNEKLTIGRTSLVYKGVEKKIILVDLYLLDLDPEQSYEKRFLKQEAKIDLLLGESRYRLISVNNQHLVLKKLHKYSTR